MYIKERKKNVICMLEENHFYSRARARRHPTLFQYNVPYVRAAAPPSHKSIHFYIVYYALITLIALLPL